MQFVQPIRDKDFIELEYGFINTILTKSLGSNKQKSKLILCTDSNKKNNQFCVQNNASI